MNLLFDRKELLASLSVGAPLCLKNKTNPALDNVRVTTKGNKCKLTFSDGESCVMKYLDTMETDGDADFLVGCGDFLRCIQSLKSPFVKIINTDRVVTIVHDNGKMDFTSPDVNDYPVFSMKDCETEVVIKNCKGMCDWIRIAKDFVCEDTLRPVLTGLHLVFDKNTVTCCATNGNKMFVDSLECENENESFSITIPSRCFNIAMNIFNNNEVVSLSTDGNKIILKTGDFKYKSVLIEGRFPNFNAVIRKTSNKCVEIPKEKLVDAVNRIMLCSNQSTKEVFVRIENGVCNVLSEDIDLGRRGKEEFACEGEPLFFSCNGINLLNAIGAINEDVVRLEYQDERSALIFKGNDDRLTITMPLVPSETFVKK